MKTFTLTEELRFEKLSQQVLEYNSQAMQLLQKDEYQKALSILLEAYNLIENPDHPKSKNLLAIILNNLGCYYKKTGDYQLSLDYLYKARSIIPQNLSDIANLAGTYLNICAVMSLIGNHTEALKSAYKAKEILSKISSKNSKIQEIIVLALQNIAIELEHLKRWGESLSAYKEAVELANFSLGPQHQLTKSLKSNLAKVKSNQSRTSRPSSLTRRYELPSLSELYNPASPYTTRLPISKSPPRVRNRNTDSMRSAPIKRPQITKISRETDLNKTEYHIHDLPKYEKYYKERLEPIEEGNEHLEILRREMPRSSEKKGGKTINLVERDEKSVISIDTPEKSFLEKTISMFDSDAFRKRVEKRVSIGVKTEVKETAAVVIERFWRNCRMKETYREKVIEKAEIKAMAAIEALENIKKEVENEDYLETPMMKITEEDFYRERDHVLDIEVKFRQFLSRIRFEKRKRSVRVI